MYFIDEPKWLISIGCFEKSTKSFVNTVIVALQLTVDKNKFSFDKIAFDKISQNCEVGMQIKFTTLAKK